MVLNVTELEKILLTGVGFNRLSHVLFFIMGIFHTQRIFVTWNQEIYPFETIIGKFAVILLQGRLFFGRGLLT